MSIEKRQILDMNAFHAKQGDPLTGSLLGRRTQNAGASSVLFYNKPLDLVSAKGCWMTDRDGVSYLDFYNNVPSVGHCHPHVVEAVSKQLAALNVNSRYLCETTEVYLEKLKATYPPHLSNVVLTCSGSEANDLALRIARANTRASGVIVTATAYHGNTSAVTDISPAAFIHGSCPDHVAIIPEPSASAYGDDIASGFAAAVKQATEQLIDKGHGIAALICDSIFSSDGVFDGPKGFLKPAVDVVKAAGGLFIADEVQPGFGRTGEAFWGFDRHGVAPDLVSMGKPMGNGYPIAGIAVRPELLEVFCGEVGYFNTFGGTPAAAAAGMAVLEVIEEEGLQDNALQIGSYLKQRLGEMAERDGRIGAVRGAGLFIGIDICDRLNGVAAPHLASQLINALRDERVLIGAAGPFGHTLKVRPPLCLSSDETDYFLEALQRALTSLPG